MSPLSQFEMSVDVIPADADALNTGSVSVATAPTSDAVRVMFDDRALPFTVLVVGTAPTSEAVYDGLLDAFAHDGTVGSVSVYPVMYPASLVRSLTAVGTVMFAVTFDEAFAVNVLTVVPFF